MDTDEVGLLRRQVELAEASARARRRWTAVVLIALVVVGAIVWFGVVQRDRGARSDMYRLDGPAAVLVA